jgi:hypothetical protein
MAKLDRVFVSTGWGSKFPLAKVTCLTEYISDHTPLLVDSGETGHRGGKRFRFEKWWLERADFNDLVKKVWTTQYRGSSLDVWQQKTSAFRKVTRGWAANVTAKISKQKQTLLAEYECLDIESEGRSLDVGEKARLKEVAREIEKIWVIEEIEARQRCRDRNILERDRNTAYFHAGASERYRKKRIECILGPQGLVYENSDILKVGAKFYKKMFRREERGACSLRSDF